MRKTGFSNGWNVVDGACGKAVANVTGEPLLRSQIGIVLWSGRLEHRRPEVGRIAEVLGKRIVGEECPPTSKPASDVNVTSFIPALRGVLEQVDAADRERCVGNGDVRRQIHAGQKAQDLEGPARPDRPGPGSSIVNKMRPLQVH